MSRLLVPIMVGLFGSSLTSAWAQEGAAPQVAADGSVTDGMLTVRDVRLAWEAFDSLPAPKEAYRWTYEPKPLYVPTLTAQVNAVIPNRRERLGSSIFPGRVFLITPEGTRIPGTELRDFAGGEGVHKWVWNENPIANITAKSFNFSFDYSTAVRTGIPAVKEDLEWDNISLGDIAVEVPTRKSTEKTTASGVKIWLESITIREAKTRPNGETGTPSIRIYGRWLPPASDPAMAVTPELTRVIGGGGPALFFDNGEAAGRPYLSRGRQTDRSDDTPGWFTIDGSLPAEVKAVNLRLSLQSTSPLKAKPDTRAMRVTVPAVLLPAPKTANLPVAIAQQPLGKGQVQLFPAFLSPQNDAPWTWRAPLFSSVPDDGTIWEDTGVVFRGDGVGVTSTGLRSGGVWKADGTPVKPGEKLRQALYSWSKRGDAGPPTKLDIETEWRHIKTETFAPTYASLPIPVAGQPSTPNLAQSLGEWGSLVLRKVAAFGPNDDLGPRFKKRTEKFLALGGLALVLEHVPATGTKSEPWDLENNYPTWNITLETATDDTKYPLRRVTDGPDGRHLSPSDELVAEDKPVGPGERFVTFYLLPPTPNAKSFTVALRVRHQAQLETQQVVFPGVVLPQQ